MSTDIDAFAAARSANRLVIKTARGGYDGRGVLLARDLAEARDFAGRISRRRRPGAGRGARVDATGAGGAGGPVAVRPGRGVAGGGDRAARRHLRGGDRASAGSGRRAGQRGQAAGAAVGRRTGRGRGAGGRVVRDGRRCADGQRAGDATAQLRPLDHGRRPHQSVRAASARGAGLPARRHRRRSRR